MGTPQINAFPYLSDGSAAPYTDGIIVGSSVDTPVSFMPTPAELTQATPPAGRKNVWNKEYIGNTGCVAADNVGHNVLAGNT